MVSYCERDLGFLLGVPSSKRQLGLSKQLLFKDGAGRKKAVNGLTLRNQKPNFSSDCDRTNETACTAGNSLLVEDQKQL